MKQGKYTYFETQPEGGYLDDVTYKKSSLVIGRPCLDVACIVDKRLVVVERSVPPMEGIWLVGGRIKWELFKDVYEYAAIIAKEHFTIDTEKNKMTLLAPRFVCFEERPYPELLLWVIINIKKKEFKNIKLNLNEQNRILTFGSKKELKVYMKNACLSTLHTSIFLDLWDELTVRKIL